KIVRRQFHMSKKANIKVLVTSNIDRALRQLKKKIEREGVVRDMKRVVYFESPTQKKRKRLIRAIKQNLMILASRGELLIKK
ncbi:MAG TPA: 30S ribosomal protein S21, partial [Candidatus Saccharimonadales bacterium]|nr:30S ribosomal protein S21 [Candidatus Saccharimonadales bacterium]